MLRLLIDPFGETVAMALAEGGKILHMVQSDERDKPLALQTAYQTLSPAELGEVVLLNGPGNFTALRVALGFTRGLALGFGIPSRGIGLFDLDFALLQNPPFTTKLYRDARGGRFYEARFEDQKCQAMVLTREIAPDGFSFENLEGALHIPATNDKRMLWLAKLAQNHAGQIPAHANYVRQPDAALPSEAPLVILYES